MYVRQLLGFLLFACLIISHESSVIRADNDSAGSETSLTTVPNTTLPEGYVAFPDVHAAYKFHSEHTSWDGARDRCIEEGARLAIADTVTKIRHINSLKRNHAMEWIHVGIYKSNETQDYFRIDDVDGRTPLTSLPWVRNFPKLLGKACIGISWWYDKLVDYSCYRKEEYFACEIPI